jgi:protein tyrosine/serine phosphatase
MKRGALDILYNFHWVAEGEAARSAQPLTPWLGEYVSARGIKAVINLRGAHPGWAWWRREMRACEAHGIAHFDARISSRRLPQKELLTALIEFFIAAPKPFLVKCSGGQDRTSFVAALYLLHRKGWGAWDEAMEQFAHFPYLHFPRRNQRWLRLFFDYAKTQANGAPIYDWLADGYDRAHFAERLKAGGHGDSFKGFLEPRKR